MRLSMGNFEVVVYRSDKADCAETFWAWLWCVYIPSLSTLGQKFGDVLIRSRQRSGMFPRWRHVGPGTGQWKGRHDAVSVTMDGGANEAKTGVAILRR